MRGPGNCFKERKFGPDVLDLTIFHGPLGEFLNRTLDLILWSPLRCPGVPGIASKTAKVEQVAKCKLRFSYVSLFDCILGFACTYHDSWFQRQV